MRIYQRGNSETSLKWRECKIGLMDVLVAISQDDRMTNASWLLNKEIRTKDQLESYCSLWHEVKQFSQNEILYMPRNLSLSCLELHNLLNVEIEKVARITVKISWWMWLHVASCNGFSEGEEEECNICLNTLVSQQWQEKKYF